MSRLLKLKTVMRNCDVWFCKARMDSNPTKFTPITWERPVLLHRTELAERSLFAVLFANPFEDPFAVEVIKTTECYIIPITIKHTGCRRIVWKRTGRVGWATTTVMLPTMHHQALQRVHLPLPIRKYSVEFVRFE